MNLVLFGGPGSGKGTQSAKLIDSFGLYHISTGEVLRDHMARGTELGNMARELCEKGHLVPDELMIELLADELDRNAKGVPGVILDGFPRTIPQALALEKLLESRGERLDAVIGLEVPQEELVVRLLNRGKAEGRADDNEETIRKRLEVYHSQTEPLKEHYESVGLYVPVNGLGVVDEIFNDIARRLEEKTGVRRRK